MMDQKERELVLKYQPHIYKDKAEPFPVRYVGCSIFSEEGMSESFPELKIHPQELDAAMVIEYAIYYDYDIQHLYDLEHIWVAVGEDGQVMDCWCSFHGMRLRAAGLSVFQVEGTHSVLYEQPGKHAMLPHPDLFELHPQFHTACNQDAGGGLLIPPMLIGKMHTDEVQDDMICRYICENFTFEPTFEFEREVLAEEQFVSLEELLEKIPKLVKEQVLLIETRKEKEMSQKKLIIFTDIGDTIIDEGSEIRKVPGGIVYQADCIPGAKETMLALYEQGYTIAMVADGYIESFQNTMNQNGLNHIFAAKSISEEFNQEKPATIMFQSALERLGLTDADKNRIIMIGNNIERDMVGAKRFGIRSVQLTWSPRYRKEAKCEEEVADYQISEPSELLELVKKLEDEL